jgi:hypothetical protein
MSDTTLKRNCVINPATDRAVKADGKIGQRVISSRQKQKERKAAPAPAPAPKPAPAPAPSQSDYITAPVIKDVEDTPFINEPTTGTGKYNLPERVKFIKQIKQLVKGIKNGDCVEPKKFGSRDGYSVRDIINLEEVIGTPSAYGVIYLTTIKGAPKSFKIASKLFEPTTGNKNEVKVMEDTTNNLILTEKSRHFLALYNNTTCRDDKLQKKMRLLSINELAHGDLKGLISKSAVMGNDNLVYNLLLQVIISIATFQKHTKLYHNDCHFGNFLYQKNIEKGHYQYRVGVEDYYLPSCDYNMMIYDFGISKKITNDINGGRYVLADYLRIMNAFINSNDRGWCNGNFIKDKVSKDIASMKREMMLKFVFDDPLNTPDKIIKFIAQKIPAFSKLRPPKIINTKAFVI